MFSFKLKRVVEGDQEGDGGRTEKVLVAYRFRRVSTFDSECRRQYGLACQQEISDAAPATKERDTHREVHVRDTYKR